MDMGKFTGDVDNFRSPGYQFTIVVTVDSDDTNYVNKLYNIAAENVANTLMSADTLYAVARVDDSAPLAPVYVMYTGGDDDSDDIETTVTLRDES